MDFLQKAILQTLIYADIFDYPLRVEELYRFLIIEEPLTLLDFKRLLPRIATNDLRINTNENYFFLKGKENLVTLRKKREKWSKQKIEIARRISECFKLIPWVKIVGITGALAMGNADEDDDIDLLIVTTKNRLWLTRFFLILLTELMGKRRRPGHSQGKAKDKICLNLFLDENHLAVLKEERNLFTAHEVCQMKLIWDRNGTFKKFLWENQWVRKFLPNAVKIKSKVKSQKSKLQFKIQNYFFDFLEKIVYKIQLTYMESRKTSEKVERYRAFFHPRDCSGWVLEEYNKRINQ